MVPSYLLSLREGLEAALIIGIVLGALRKVHRTELRSVVWGGVFSATLVSVIVAFVLYRLGAAFEGEAEEIFEGFTMLLAAGVLTWMIFWMHRQSRSIKSELETGVRQASITRGKSALFSLAFLAVVREGIELALFLTAASYATDSQQTIGGALLGLGTSVLLGWSLFATTARLDLRRFFQVTGILLILFAAGLVAHGVHEFIEVGWIPALIEHVWDINPLIDENSTVGALLKALFGYNGNPALTEVLAYIGYFVLVAFSLRRRQVQLPAIQEA
ncbi:MAG: FTR1 family protein [Anaerolineales bacterium]|nr:MAG: FTR1 family protein [Anaerolineales bacterium]